MAKAFDNQPNKQANKTESLMVSFDNNSSLMLWPEDGTIKSIIYPPPTPTTINQLIFCMALNRVFLLLASGSLCVYKAHNRETATLDKLQFSVQIKDYEGKKLSQHITAMNLISVAPPPFDCEIFSDLHKYVETNITKTKDSSDSEEVGDILKDLEGVQARDHVMEEYTKQLALRKNDEFLICGLDTGTIIFLNVH